jgi:hypothetical protein
MGVTYVHIDSKDRMHHETTSKMLVRLSTPIQKATSVKLVSFSTANELYTVDEGNNVLTINIQNLTSSSELNERIEPLEIVIRIPAGIYTTERLITVINSLITDTYPTAADRDHLDISFELLTDDSNRVSIVTRPTEDQPVNTLQRVTLYYPGIGEAPPFGTSVIHRLGFSRQQVCPHRAPFVIDSFGPGSTGNFFDAIIYGSNRGILIPENDVEYIGLNPQSPNDDTATAINIGWETHPFLYILSDELVKHATRTHSNADGSVATTSTDILQKIPINVNLYNWIHFFGSEYTFEHQLDGRTIPHFDIAMANFERQTFPNQHFKDFQLTLEFQTMEADEDVNKAAITALAKKGYAIRHSR